VAVRPKHRLTSSICGRATGWRWKACSARKGGNFKGEAALHQYGTEIPMHFAKAALAVAFLVTVGSPSFAHAIGPLNPNGSFVDSYGTSFRLTLCGKTGTDLCGVLTNLEGRSATPENLTFVGRQVMHATRSAANQWKGSLSVGNTNADATVTMVDADTVEIQGCRAAILCETLTYKRAPHTLPAAYAP